MTVVILLPPAWRHSLGIIGKGTIMWWSRMLYQMWEWSELSKWIVSVLKQRWCTFLTQFILHNVANSYHIDSKEVGHGHYGVVRKCMHRETGEWYAIKSIRKAKVSKIEVLKREIDILKEVRHPNIIRLVSSLLWKNLPTYKDVKSNPIQFTHSWRRLKCMKMNVICI